MLSITEKKKEVEEEKIHVKTSKYDGNFLRMLFVLHSTKSTFVPMGQLRNR